jgi:hypothetical protein
VPQLAALRPEGARARDPSIEIFDPLRVNTRPASSCTPRSLPARTHLGNVALWLAEHPTSRHASR